MRQFVVRLGWSLVLLINNAGSDGVVDRAADERRREASSSWVTSGNSVLTGGLDDASPLVRMVMLANTDRAPVGAVDLRRCRVR